MASKAVCYISKLHFLAHIYVFTSPSLQYNVQFHIDMKRAEILRYMASEKYVHSNSITLSTYS